MNVFVGQLNNSRLFPKKLSSCHATSSNVRNSFNFYKYFVNRILVHDLDEKTLITRGIMRNQPMKDRLPEDVDLSKTFDLTIFYILFPIFDVLLVSYGLVKVLITLSKALTFKSKFILCLATTVFSSDSLTFPDADYYNNIVSRQFTHYKCSICMKPLTSELSQMPFIANAFLSNRSKCTFMVVSESHVLPNIIVLALTFTILLFLPLWINNFLKLELFPVSLGSNYFEVLSEYHAEENNLTINASQEGSEHWKGSSFQEFVEFKVLQEFSSNLGIQL